jgi:hypothetical protein
VRDREVEELQQAQQQAQQQQAQRVGQLEIEAAKLKAELQSKSIVRIAYTSRVHSLSL